MIDFKMEMNVRVVALRQQSAQLLDPIVDVESAPPLD